MCIIVIIVIIVSYLPIENLIAVYIPPYESELYVKVGLAVNTAFLVHADQCSSFIGSNNHFCLLLLRLLKLLWLILQVNALLATLELRESAGRKGHFALYNCLVIGHTKYNGVQRVYCNPFPAKQFHGSHRLDHVIFRPPGIDHGGFVVSPDSVWYAQVLLLF